MIASTNSQDFLLIISSLFLAPATPEMPILIGIGGFYCAYWGSDPEFFPSSAFSLQTKSWHLAQVPLSRVCHFLFLALLVPSPVKLSMSSDGNVPETNFVCLSFHASTNSMGLSGELVGWRSVLVVTPLV